VNRDRSTKRFIYLYDKTTLVGLEQLAAPELEAPFIAAMKDLKARRAFQAKR
jgi:hypothetical protein